ncbi:MAG: DUF4172 domain-containing protein [Desulfotignum sp.]
MKYIWQHKTWPRFTWNSDALLKPLGKVRFTQGSFITFSDWIFRHDSNQGGTVAG